MIVYGYSLIGTRLADELKYSTSLNLKLDISKLAASDGDAEFVKVIV